MNKKSPPQKQTSAKKSKRRAMEEVQRDTAELLRVLAPVAKALSHTQGTGSSAQKKDRAVWEVSSNELG